MSTNDRGEFRRIWQTLISRRHVLIKKLPAPAGKDDFHVLDASGQILGLVHRMHGECRFVCAGSRGEFRGRGIEECVIAMLRAEHPRMLRAAIA